MVFNKRKITSNGLSNLTAGATKPAMKKAFAISRKKSENILADFESNIPLK